MGSSERHTWRLLAAYRKEGAAALSHGNRRRAPGRTIPGQVKARVLESAGGTRGGLSHARLTEILAEREELKLSRSAARRILVSAGIKSPRHRRRPKHRIRRERYSQEGMLLQIDGTIHFAGQLLQPLPDMQRISYARGRVLVQERLDGGITVSCQGETIAVRQAPPHPVASRARNGRHGDGALQTEQALARLDPAPHHPWTRPLLTKSQNN